MGNRTESQTAKMLHSRQNRMKYMALLVCLAVLVTAGIGAIFHLNAIAKTYQETVLTCTAEPQSGPEYADFFVHTHNDDCFDADQNLVCALPEIEAHTHDASCYTTQSVLICTVPESDGHQHTEECYTTVQGELICGESTEPIYDEDGNVIEEGHVHTDECYAWTKELSCGMAEGEGAHHHDDACFETVTTLTCDKPEIILHTHTDDCWQKDENGALTMICGLPEVTEHVHGPECFTVYELDDGEPEETVAPEEAETEEGVSGELEEADEAGSEEDTGASDEAATGEEEKTGEETESEKEETETEKTAAEETAGVSMPEQSFHGATDDIEVDVMAPEGAFPEGTTMTVTAVTDDETLSTLADAVDGKVMNVQAVDIVFLNAEGEQIEPLVPIRVNMKAAIISEGDDVALVHLPETQSTEQADKAAEAEESPTPSPETPAAQIVEAERIPAEADPTATEDAISFESDAFSIYGLVSVSIEKTVLASNGVNYKITMTCGDETGIPENAELTVEEILPETADDGETSAYDEYLEKTAEALGWETAAAQYARFFDITIVGEDGGKLQPAEGSTVSVKIELADTESSSLNVVHFGDENTEVMEFSQETVHEGCELSFEAGSFSVYAIVDAPEPATQSGYNKVATVEQIAELGSQGFYMHNPGGFYFKSEAYSPKAGRTGIKKTKPSNNADKTIEGAIALGAVKYYFEHVQDNQFRVYYLDGEKKMYIRQLGNSLLLTEVLQPDTNTATSTFTVSLFPTGNNPNTFNMLGVNGFYWNMQGNDAGEGFCAYTGGADANARIQLEYYYTQPTDPYGLDGKTFGIAYHNDSTTAAALAVGAAQTISSRDMLMKPDVLSNDGILLVAENSDIQEWTFESIGEDKYYIKTTVDGETKYLTINSANVTLADDQDSASAITATPGTGANSGKWHFTVNGFSLNLSGSTFNAANNSNATTWMNLVEKSSLTDDDFVNYTARKISASDDILSATEKDANGEIRLDEEGHVVYKKDKAQVVLYTRVWNDTTKKYEYYAVDHDGSLIRVYESGDQINWIGNQVNSALWEFTEYTNDDGTPNYYYELENTAYPNTFLAPQNGNIISNHTVGLNMEGRQEGFDYTNILAWDDAAYAYSGLKVTDENGGKRVVACPMDEAADFHFAVITPATQQADQPTTVATVDNTEHGIIMKMIDFNNSLLNDRDSVQNPFFGAHAYNATNPDTGLLSTNLTGGYPQTTSYTGNAGQSLSKLFTGMASVNHLFIQSVYNESGYFEYDSTQNFATLLDENGNVTNTFTVYNQLGAFEGDTGKTRTHGQFMPYNDISCEVGYNRESNGKLITNQTDVSGNELPDNDPRKGEPLYMIRKTDADYFFGMELSASFTQTPDGLDNWGHDIIFEFTGDDDFWLYVDGELVLDLGGVHQALPGSVNFRTGKVNVNGTWKTLRELFRQNYIGRGHTEAEANEYVDGIFEKKLDGNGNALKDSNGNDVYAFKDYSIHTMKMFYMERGAGASNLKMRFNLASVQPGTVELSKKLAGAQSASNKLIQYPYQIWYSRAVPQMNANGDGYLLDPDGNVIKTYENPVFMRQAASNSENMRVVYKGTNTLVPYREQLTIDGITYNHVFLLRPGETAVVMLPDHTDQYKIVECGINTDVYERVEVNGAEIFGMPYNNDDGVIESEGTPVETIPQDTTKYVDSTRSDFGIPYKTTDERSRVEYTNTVTPDAMRTLDFKKVLYNTEGRLMSDEDAANVSSTFNFRLYLGNEFADENNLSLANKYSYYVKDPNGHYCKWNTANRCFDSLNISEFEGPGGLADYLSNANSTERSSIVFTTSLNGSISNIPAGYTVEVRDLIVGSKYKVEERDAEIPKGYTRRDSDGYVRKDTDPGYVYYTEDGFYGKHVLTEGSTKTAEPISDTIASKEDSPKIEVRNQEGWGLTAEKVWTDKDFMIHDPIYLAVYLKGSDENTLGDLVAGSVRRLNTNDTEVYWFFPDLRVNNAEEPYTFDQFIVREVTLTGTPVEYESTGVVTGYANITPVENGDSVSVNAKTISGTNMSETYTVSYQPGQSTGQNHNIRSDTITNSRPGIMFYKTQWNGTTPLESARFTLKDAGTGNDVTLKSTLTSDAAGLITTAYLSEGTYKLTEVATPKGYEGLPGPITITVRENDTLTFQLGEDTEHTVTMSSAGSVTGDNTFFTVEPAPSTSDMRAIVKIKNRRSELRVFKEDAETKNKLQGVHFALYEQVTGQDGKPRKSYSPMTGYEDLVTGIYGLLPKVALDLPAGTYYLVETQTLEGYRPLDEDIIFTVGQDGTFTVNSSEHKEWLTSADNNGTTSYTLTIPNGNRKDMTFHKVWYPIGTSTEKQQWKQNITVTLYKTAGESGTAIADYTIHMEQGTLTAAGTPKVSGEQAPEIVVNTPTGYDYSFTIKDLPYGDTFYITENEMEMNLIGYGENKNGTITVTPGAKQATDETNYIINRDTGGYELPSTGGRGTGLFTAIGAMLTMTAGAVLTVRKKRTCSG